MKLWFDCGERKIVTETELHEWHADWLKEMAEENGLPYMIEHPEYYNFAAYEQLVTGYSGELVPVYNAEHFEEVKPDEAIHG